MRLKKEINLIKTICSIFSLGYLLISSASAQELDCSDKKKLSSQMICSSDFQQQKQKLETQAITAHIVTDAPLRLLQDTQIIWLNQLKRCKSQVCYQQQFDGRIDQLNFFASLNQSLTQHYLKVEDGYLLSKQPVHIQIHQLSKNNIKIEGTAYLNPNNKSEKQTLSLLAYSSPDAKTEIINNNNDCKYSVKYTKSYITMKSLKKGCEPFNGIYRLYD